MVERPRHQSLDYNIDGIIKNYAEYKLPVLTNKERLFALLDDPHCATGDLFRLLRTDPIFAFYAQHRASEKQKGRLSEIHGLEHALSMIGVDGIKEISRYISYASNNAADWQQICAESVLAEAIADELAELKTSNRKIVSSSALFTRATEWLMYWLHPRRSWQIRRMHGRRPFKQDKVADALFGFSYVDMQEKIAETFGLPDLNYRIAHFTLSDVIRDLMHALDKYRANKLLLEEESRALRLKVGAAEMAPIIANRLAEASCSPWLKNSWGRWIDLASIHYHKPKNTIYSAIFRAFKKIDQMDLKFPLRTPYSGLLSPGDSAPYENFLSRTKVQKKHSKATKRPPLKPKNHQQAAQASEAISTTQPQTTNTAGNYNSTDRAYIMGFYNTLVESKSNSGARTTSVKEDISQALTLLIKHTPINRCSFLMLNQSCTAAKSVMSFVDSDRLDAFSLMVPINKIPIWKKFTEKQAFLLLNQSKYQKFWPFFPKPILTNNVEAFLLNSIAYDGRVRALLYADFGGPVVALSKDFIHDIKHLCAGLSARLRAG